MLVMRHCSKELICRNESSLFQLTVKKDDPAVLVRHCVLIHYQVLFYLVLAWSLWVWFNKFVFLPKIITNQREGSWFSESVSRWFINRSEQFMIESFRLFLWIDSLEISNSTERFIHESGNTCISCRFKGVNARSHSQNFRDKKGSLSIGSTLDEAQLTQNHWKQTAFCWTVSKSAWENPSPSLEIPDLMDSYWNDWILPTKNSASFL